MNAMPDAGCERFRSQIFLASLRPPYHIRMICDGWDQLAQSIYVYGRAHLGCLDKFDTAIMY